MKRFTETTKWTDPWFRKLTPALKCLWGYFCDTCDAAGVIEPDWELISMQIGAEVTERSMLAFAGRVEKLDSKKWWISKFIPFQYGRVSIHCKPHRPVFDSIEHHGLRERVSKAFANPLDTLQEKDKEKDKDQIGTEGCGEGQKIGTKRLHGIPDSADPVIAYGRTLVPPIPEARCRAFFAHYEGQARTGPDGEIFWITSANAVVTNWKIRLPEFKGHENRIPGHQKSFDRNAGTTNEGKSGQYAGVGKLGGVSNAGGPAA